LPALTCGVGPVVLDLIERVEFIEQELDLAPTTILLDDDFEDGIDPAWVQVYGTTQTIAPTSCEDFNSNYTNCGSLGLHFDESERYDYEVSAPTTGSFSLYFHDDPADTLAAAWIGVLSPGGQERLGVETGACPNHYYISLNAGTHRCTLIPRRKGWHRVEFVRSGLTTKGYLDHVLMFETNRSDRYGFTLITVIQEVPWALLDGFAIDDVRFEAYD